MKRGFFRSSKTQIKHNHKSSLPACGRCKRYNKCKSPKMLPQGEGEIKVLHIAESPSFEEDKRGEQLIGEAGKFYKQTLKEFRHDISLAKKTNAVICYNEKEIKKSHIVHCRPNLFNTMESFNPHTTIILGDTALKSLLQPKFSKEIGTISKWRGAIIPDREHKTWICPTFHPSYVIKDSTSSVVEKIFKEDIKHALLTQDLPFPALKNEEECVEIIKHPKNATTYLRDLFHTKKLIAFDYETTGLKPQSYKQQIKSISICDDVDHVVTFKMFDDFDFIDVLRHVLEIPKIKKICANIKFERDWTATKLRTILGGCFFDTMIAAHFLDNRSGITGLKHQAYITFGTAQYDAHINKFLEADAKLEGGNSLNQIDKIDTRDLLMYNAIDSLCEFRLAIVQMDILGINYQQYYEGPSGKELAPQMFIGRS